MSVYIDNIFTGFINDPKTCQNFVFDNPHTLVLHDKFPNAKIHLLIVPKGKYTDIYQYLLNATPEEKEDFDNSVKQTIEKFDIYDKGFKIIVNTKESHLQSVPHYHMHLLCNIPVESKT